MTLQVIEPIITSLHEFIINNPESCVEENDELIIIKKPWGDETLVFETQKNNLEAIKSLNFLRLPPRFTGLWHMDTGDLEFIFTYVRNDDPICSNIFLFNFKGQSFNCGYSKGTERLQKILDIAKPIARASDSNYRNLGTINLIKTMQKRDTLDTPDLYQLTSFFIRNVRISEDDLPDLAHHINFYMTYFDIESPRIIIHPEPIQDKETITSCRYPFGRFPTEITSQVLDPFLLTLWESAVDTTDPIRQFITCFQILEYAAFYYMRDDILRNIRRALSMPEAAFRQDDICKEILDTISKDRPSDEERIKYLIHQVVDPKVIWKEIEQNILFFSEATVFDGNFSLDALIKKESSVDDFKADWFPKFPASIIDLRNALIHAREKRQSSCITPTKKNLHLLKPWAKIAFATSVQVILYRDI